MTLASVLNFTPPDLPPPNLADNTERRGVFVLSLVFGALAVVHKQRCLSCRPTDVVILNAWLAFSQIIAVRAQPHVCPVAVRCIVCGACLIVCYIWVVVWCAVGVVCNI